MPVKCGPSPGTGEIRLSEVIAPLSYALDLSEGQPEGHTVRSCLIGMRLAAEIGLSDIQRSDLFYALLLKDIGCSSNAAQVASLFGADDHRVKRALKTTDWSRLSDSLRYVARNVAPHATPIERARRVVEISLKGQGGARDLVQTRCNRGAEIARMLGFSQEAAAAIRTLDEHWDGRGQPEGLHGQQIPLLGRIVCLAQTVEVFLKAYGLDAAWEMAEERRGRWFDPALVDALGALRRHTLFWQRMRQKDLETQVAALEPEDRVLIADDLCLNRVAEAYARVVDAKSPWTCRHSEGVADVAVGIGAVLGFSGGGLQILRRAALVHDIGKLGVSNMILDKPGALTEEERVEMRRHPVFTERILLRVASFCDLAFWSAAHHERLDGRGYPRGLTASELTIPARILAVADVYDALSAERPYRPRIAQDEALDIMRLEVGNGLCPDAFRALTVYLEKAHSAPGMSGGSSSAVSGAG